MAMVDVSEYCMKMKVPEISILDEVWSPEISIHGIPWKVQVCKQIRDDEPWLGIYLYCANDDQTSNWLLWGTASAKLLSFSYEVEPVVYHSSKFVYDRSGIGYGKPNFIQWNELFDEAKNYVKNDTIRLEVNVKAENPNDPNRSRLKFNCIRKFCNNNKFAIYRMNVSNVSNLAAVRSQTFELYGIMWGIQISKEDESYLGVLLQVKEDSEAVSCKMSMSIKLVSSKKKVQSIEKFGTKQYHFSTTINFIKVVSWKRLMKPENGFVNSDSIMLEITLTPVKPEGDVANDAKADQENKANTKQMECAICLEYIDNQDISCTPCGHLFCFECIKKAITNRDVCPACAEPVQLSTLRQLYLPFIN